MCLSHLNLLAKLPRFCIKIHRHKVYSEINCVNCLCIYLDACICLLSEIHFDFISYLCYTLCIISISAYIIYWMCVLHETLCFISSLDLNYEANYCKNINKRSFLIFDKAVHWSWLFSKISVPPPSLFLSLQGFPMIHCHRIKKKFPVICSFRNECGW